VPERLDAVVVGAGPNGLAAAVELARAGRSVLVLEAADAVGGGARTAELTLPGYRHDVCSAVHPLAVASPFLRALPLAEHGLRFVHPELPLAHPLDDGAAAVLHRSLDETAAALGADGAAYARLVGPLVRAADAVAETALSPPLRLPAHPAVAARLAVSGVRAAAALAARRFRGTAARALLAGSAAHAMLPLERAGTAGVGLLLQTLGHAVGWPVAVGGSQAIADALTAHLRALGGEVATGREVRTLADVPPARAVLLDLTPRRVLAVAGPALPERYRRALRRYRYGPGVFKLDLALAGPVPWLAPGCRRAGTVHVGGTLEEIGAAERAVAAGRMPERPFVLVAQQSLVDATRAPAGRHTLWAYCHVPPGSDADAGPAIEAQLERFAPGFGQLVLARRARGPAELEADDPNRVGGDIAGGAADLRQLLARPVLRASPYRTPDPALLLCSSSTPPGPGVHGMCGFHAARTALRGVLADRR
jgi:phytoene dehydrogenase-like protein